MFDLGRVLYDRLGGLGRHVDKLGRDLTKAVSSYNQAVGSLESRVLVTARRLNELGVVDSELDPLLPVEGTTRALSAPELTASGPPEIGLEIHTAIAPPEIGSPTEAGRPVGLVRAAR